MPWSNHGSQVAEYSKIRRNLDLESHTYKVAFIPQVKESLNNIKQSTVNICGAP